MKSIVYLSIFFCLTSGAALIHAQELEGATYVVQMQNRTPVPFDSCSDALPFLGGQPLRSAVSADLYAVHTKNTDGSVLNNDIRKVGSIVTCVAEPTPELERGSSTADFGLISQMTLNGKEYTIGGSSRLRTDPTSDPFGFPQPNTEMALLTLTGTVYKSFYIDYPPVTVGSMSGNFLSNPLAAVGFEEQVVMMISIYERPARKIWSLTGKGWVLN